MDTLQRYWPVLLLVISFIGVLMQGASLWQHHIDTELRRCERLTVLEQLAAIEHPDQTLAVYFKGSGAGQC